MKRTGILTLCALLVLSCSAMAMTAEIGRVTAIEGRVDVTRAPDNEAVPLAEGAPVFVGDSIRAKDHSKAEIIFADKSVIRIAPNTRMEIKDFAVNGSARKSAQIHIARGKILADVSRTGSPDTFIITTPNAKGSVRGTEVIFLYQAERTSALVKDGRLSIYNAALPDQKKEIAGGEAIMVPFDSPPDKPRPYMDAEFALHEQDTKPVIFRAVSLGKGAAFMRGAITTLMGGVRILKKGGADWHYAKLNESVEEGDKIETTEDGRMSLMLDNGNIIQIQPNSQIMLLVLKKDPKTGEFDNTFEVDVGKIKAIVEKLGKSSNFRVKTPTALCGVKGTIMYLDVSQSSTQAFYEGGGGVVTSTISGDTQFVESGQNTVSTAAGTISAPAATSTDQKMACEATFEYGAAGGGYTAPENSAPDTKGGGTTVPGADPNPDTKTQTGGDGVVIPANLVPITEVIPPTAKPKTSIESVSFSGLVGRVSDDGTNCLFSPESPTNSVSGSFTLSGSITSAWTTGVQGSVTGNVSCSADIPSSYAFWRSDSIACTTANGGQYRGWLGASLSTRLSGLTTTTLWNKALFLYRDPYGWAGTMTFDAGGTYDPSVKYFSSDSESVLFNQRQLLGSTYSLNTQTLETENIYARGTGSFPTGGGTIACGTSGSNVGLSGTTFNLPLMPDWGIWQIQAQGTYSGTTSNDWALALGGKKGSSSCRWLGTIDGSLWDDRAADKTNQIKGGFEGVFFDDAATGYFEGGSILNGDIVGIAGLSAGNWQAIGGGEFLVAYESFTEAGLGFNLGQLSSFVNVPITQVAAVNMTLNSQTLASFTAFNMDTRVYENAGGTYWTGIIDGGFSAQPTGTWTATLTGASSSTLNLKDGTWSGGSWSAVVDPSGSSVATHAITTGQAGGTYDTASGTFEGVAAGKTT